MPAAGSRVHAAAAGWLEAAPTAGCWPRPTPLPVAPPLRLRTVQCHSRLLDPCHGRGASAPAARLPRRPQLAAQLPDAPPFWRALCGSDAATELKEGGPGGVGALGARCDLSRQTPSPPEQAAKGAGGCVGAVYSHCASYLTPALFVAAPGRASASPRALRVLRPALCACHQAGPLPPPEEPMRTFYNRLLL